MRTEFPVNIHPSMINPEAFLFSNSWECASANHRKARRNGVRAKIRIIHRTKREKIKLVELNFILPFVLLNNIGEGG